MLDRGFVCPFIFLILASLVYSVVAYAQDTSLRPKPPRRFDVSAVSGAIELSWSTHAGESDPVSWEIYRTVDYVDNLPYKHIQTLPGSARSFLDDSIAVNTGYFYYIVAVGEPTPVDPYGLAGTPDGRPFRSGRYFAQTNDLAAVGVKPGIDPDTLYQIGPNPFFSETDFRYVARGPGQLQIKVFNTLGREVAVLKDEFITDFDFGDVHWNGRDHSGRRVPSGVYYCQLAVVPYYKMSVSMAIVR